MKNSTKDILIRAVKTFWQAALASLIIALPNIISAFGSGTVRDIHINSFIPILCGILSAGISAVYNGIIKPHMSKTPSADLTTPPTDVKEDKTDKK